jgi:hypothetical protein
MSHDQDLRARTGSPPEAWPSTPPPDTQATGRTGQGQDPHAHAGAPGIGGQERGDPGQPGTCYLLHFSEPYKHARHYSGSATDLRAGPAAATATPGSPRAADPPRHTGEDR